MPFSNYDFYSDASVIGDRLGIPSSIEMNRVGDRKKGTQSLSIQTWNQDSINNKLLLKDTVFPAAIDVDARGSIAVSSKDSTFLALVVRYVDDLNFYYLEMRTASSYVKYMNFYRVKNGTTFKLYGSTAGIPQGYPDMLNIRVVLSGANIQVYNNFDQVTETKDINDWVLRASITDTDPLLSAGRCGFYFYYTVNGAGYNYMDELYLDDGNSVFYDNFEDTEWLTPYPEWAWPIDPVTGIVFEYPVKKDGFDNPGWLGSKSLRVAYESDFDFVEVGTVDRELQNDTKLGPIGGSLKFVLGTSSETRAIFKESVFGLKRDIDVRYAYNLEYADASNDASYKIYARYTDEDNHYVLEVQTHTATENVPKLYRVVGGSKSLILTADPVHVTDFSAIRLVAMNSFLYIYHAEDIGAIGAPTDSNLLEWSLVGRIVDSAPIMTQGLVGFGIERSTALQTDYFIDSINVFEGSDL